MAVSKTRLRACFIALIAALAACCIAASPAWADKGLVTGNADGLATQDSGALQAQAGTYKIIFKDNWRDNNWGYGYNNGYFSKPPFFSRIPTQVEQEVPVGKAVALQASVFEQAGYQFTGWNTKRKGTGVSYEDGQKVKDLAAAGKVVRLYAQWEKAPVTRAGFEYAIVQGKAKITGYKGKSKTAVIPRRIKGAEVVSCDIAGTGLKAIDARKASFLEELVCGGKKLEKLTLGKNTRLKILRCPHSKLTKLDVPKCPNLIMLLCNNNRLKSLNVTKCPKLIALDCSQNRLTALNVTRNRKLDYLNVYANRIKYLDVTKNRELSRMSCASNALKTLNVTKNRELANLICADNKLKELDLSNNPKLRYLQCECNRLVSLDLSKNRILSTLHCYDNKIESLDLSKNVEIFFVNCDNNKIDVVTFAKKLNYAREYFMKTVKQKGENVFSKEKRYLVGFWADEETKAATEKANPKVELAGFVDAGMGELGRP